MTELENEVVLVYATYVYGRVDRHSKKGTGWFQEPIRTPSRRDKCLAHPPGIEPR